MLTEQGLAWEEVGHVTATASLARAIQQKGVVASPIATLIDLIVWPGVKDYGVTLDGFPGPDVMGRQKGQVYEDQVRNWQMLVRGRQMRLGIKFDEALRQFAAGDVADNRLTHLLVRSRRDFALTLRTLASSGVRPSDITPRNELGATAARAWAKLETDLPALTAYRNDLWIDSQEFQAQNSVRAQELRERIENAIERVYGVRRGKRVLVHHGFYFFTPPQWALFQLLRQIPNLDQIFIIHDDGRNPAFDTWRRFFSDKWDMPTPVPWKSVNQSEVVDHPAATAFLCSLRGERVATDHLKERLSILECRNPAELVRQWRLETSADSDLAPRWYAADANSVERFMRRLAREGEGSVDLAQLPIGTFLLAVHDCIVPVPQGGVRLVITEGALLDIVASGFLVTENGTLASESDVDALRRALPFFTGCTSLEQWRTRAEHLHRLIIAEVDPLGPRGDAVGDLQRIQAAASNPLRLAPWADLSRNEASRILDVVQAATKLVEKIAARERVVLREHLNFLKESLATGMQQLRENERQAVVAKVQGFSVGLDEEVAVEGVVDIVQMVLGQSPEYEDLDDPTSKKSFVNDLRGLDAIGLHPQSGNLHLANLAEGLFPSRPKVVGWPFDISELFQGAASVEQAIVLEILKLRSENPSLSDLYLLWLALNGTQEGGRVTLSWISDLDGQQRSLSSLVSLLILPADKKSAIAQRAGGLVISNVENDAMSQTGPGIPVPEHAAVSLADLNGALERIDNRAAASAIACARRLALQWVVGPSHAFQSAHHQAMLYGNMIGALIKDHGFSAGDAQRLADDLWRYLTAGQRRSSLSKSRVKPSSSSSPAAWILTLGGRQKITTHDRPVDFAYRATLKSERPSPAAAVPEGSRFLPPGVNHPETCKACPVRRQCAVWAEDPR
ncbi:hypothetical protein J2T22_001106 [Pseudarthrobacter defluvii]|uniref:PD-(D/E)XK nuclease superfamily protein n=1 Tax=Pseudarthrobacter defluvii TaxID=410837 RepID=A0ABT9UE59_9MICC|nr:hypothetical protein [Pseudarthrobacter defluvii]MDQ0117933.1 hypothetical protein [Pseudarthrobacter defluvii]